MPDWPEPTDPLQPRVPSRGFRSRATRRDKEDEQAGATCAKVPLVVSIPPPHTRLLPHPRRFCFSKCLTPRAGPQLSKRSHTVAVRETVQLNNQGGAVPGVAQQKRIRLGPIGGGFNPWPWSVGFGSGVAVTCAVGQQPQL